MKTIKIIKTVMISTLMILSIMSGVIWSLTEEEIIINDLNIQHDNKLNTIDCVQATVSFNPIQALCDLNDVCQLTYSFEVSEIDYTSGMSKIGIGNWSDTRVYFNINKNQIGTKFHEDLLKDKAKDLETQSKNSCKAYKNRLKSEYKYEVLLE